MFQTLSLSTFLKKKPLKPTEPFPLLLDDEEELSSFKLRFPRQAVDKALKLAFQAQQEIKTLISELQAKAISEGTEYQNIQETKYLAGQLILALQEIEMKGIPALERPVILSSSWLLGPLLGFLPILKIILFILPKWIS